MSKAHLYPTATHAALTGDGSKFRTLAERWEREGRPIKVNLITTTGKRFRGAFAGAGGLMIGLTIEGKDIGIGYGAIAFMEEEQNDAQNR